MLYFYQVDEAICYILAGKGLKAIVYLDDGIIAVKGEAAALEAISQVKQDLQSAGFVTNTEK